jgi:hypothetical protein
MEIPVIDQAFAALHIENDTGLPYTNGLRWR